MTVEINRNFAQSSHPVSISLDQTRSCPMPNADSSDQIIRKLQQENEI